MLENAVATIPTAYSLESSNKTIWSFLYNSRSLREGQD